MQKLIAIWNGTAGVWEMSESLICGHSALYSETWPTSGGMRNGRAFERPTPELRTAVSECSSLLPTPTADDMGANKTPEQWDEWTERMRAKHGNGNGRLLPTPTSGDSVGIGYATDVSQLTKADQPHRLRDAVNAISLLPTPTAKQGRNATAGRQEDAKFNTGTTLNDVAYTNQFGEYTAAIRRWEQVLGRPAPPPTEPGQNGKQRLSPRFVEWLMGLPDGWVTDVPGITRSAALKALGNGVVPQQAALALELLDGA